MSQRNHAQPGDGSPGSEGGGMSYEQLIAALEALTGRMASDEIGIEEAADLYERAGRLHALAAERLARVQERIDRMTGEGG